MMQRVTQEVKIAITSLVLVKQLSTHGPRGMGVNLLSQILKFAFRVPLTVRRSTT